MYLLLLIGGIKKFFAIVDGLLHFPFNPPIDCILSFSICSKTLEYAPQYTNTQTYP